MEHGQRIRLYQVLVSLLLLILIFTCNRNNDDDYNKGSDNVTTKFDTVWKYKTDTILKTVKVTEVKFVKPHGEKYTPSQSIDTCKTRFDALLKEHSQLTVYTDTIVLDSLGSITIKDTVWLNKLQGKRQYFYDYKIPNITKTVTEIRKEEPKRQIYLGASIFGPQTFSPGILYKDRKDRIYQANILLSNINTVSYGLGFYWKLKLKQKNGNK